MRRGSPPSMTRKSPSSPDAGQRTGRIRHDLHLLPLALQYLPIRVEHLSSIFRACPIRMRKAAPAACPALCSTTAAAAASPVRSNGIGALPAEILLEQHRMVELAQRSGGQRLPVPFVRQLRQRHVQPGECWKGKCPGASSAANSPADREHASKSRLSLFLNDDVIESQALGIREE